MGAEWFSVVAHGKTAKEAFGNAIEDAQYESGHGGYTGTIAEKDSFVMVGERETSAEAYALADDLCDADDKRIVDKWGPAGCIKVTGTANAWVFCGWASS